MKLGSYIVILELLYLPVCPPVRVYGFLVDNKNLLLNCSTFLDKFGVVVYHHELECVAKTIVCYLQSQSYSEGSYNMTAFTVNYLLNCQSFYNQTLFNGMSFAQVALLAVLKVRVTANVHNVK